MLRLPPGSIDTTLVADVGERVADFLLRRSCHVHAHPNRYEMESKVVAVGGLSLLEVWPATGETLHVCRLLLRLESVVLLRHEFSCGTRALNGEYPT